MRAAVVAFLLAALLTPEALGATSPKFVERPYLVALSNGAYVHYRLDRKPSSQAVLIDGKQARVIAVPEEAKNVYHALVVSPRMKIGGTYSVSITVAGARIFHGLLVVHKRHPRR